MGFVICVLIILVIIAIIIIILLLKFLFQLFFVMPIGLDYSNDLQNAKEILVSTNWHSSTRPN